MTSSKPSLASVLATAEKKYDFKAGRLSDIIPEVKAISTGNLAIDTAIGVGGLPLGRSVELSGPPSSGKTTTALQVAANLQAIIKAGGDPERGIGPDDRIVYLDYENALDPRYAIALGFTPDDETCIFAQPDNLEAGADFVLEVVRTGQVRMVIIDSVAAMVPQSVGENSVGKSLPALAARLLTTFSQTVNPALKENNCLLVLLNHTKEAIGMGGYGPPQTTTPGGKSIKYFASVRLEYKPIKIHKTKKIDPITKEEMEVPTATDVRIEVKKNKVGVPFRRAVARVRYGRGFDNFWTALQVLLADKQIMYSSGMYYFHKLEEQGQAPAWMARQSTGTHRPYIKGEENVFRAGDEHPEWRAALITLAEETVERNVNLVEEATAEPEDSELDIESKGDDTKRIDL